MMAAVLPTTARNFHDANPCAAHDSRTISTAAASTASETRTQHEVAARRDDGHVETTASAQQFPAHSSSADSAGEAQQNIKCSPPPHINVAAEIDDAGEAAPKKSDIIEPPLEADTTAKQENNNNNNMCLPEQKPAAPKSNDDDEHEVAESSVAVAEKAAAAHDDSVASVPPSMEEEDDDPETPKTDNKKKKKNLILKPGQSAGRWTQQEHQAFLEGLKVFGREWKKVAQNIPTRTSAQIRSHAQKYFAKLAREEHSLQACSDAVVPTTTTTTLAPSVQRNVDRILADPMGAQQEVEDTLRALRERYRQLQIRLQERNNRATRHGTMGSNIVQDEDDGDSLSHQEEQRRRSNIMERRKRPFQDLSTHHQQHHDEMSSVSSPTSLASWSPSRELGDQELTAVLVLGGTLPRSSSNQDLRNRTNAAGQANSSSSSSVESNHQDDDTSENKRQRRMSGDGGGHKSDSDDSGQNDRMVL